MTGVQTCALPIYFEALLTLLDPEVVLRADQAAVALGASPETRGRDNIAAFLSRARGTRPVFVDGCAAAAWIQADRVRIVFSFDIRADLIAAIDLIGDTASLAAFDLTIPEPTPTPTPTPTRPA